MLWPNQNGPNKMTHSLMCYQLPKLFTDADEVIIKPVFTCQRLIRVPHKHQQQKDHLALPECINSNCCVFCRGPLFNRSKGHGSGCTTALHGINRVYCVRPPTSWCSDNTQNLHGSTVEWMPKQCPHSRPTVNVLAHHPTLRS